jgi:hypothetical protein
MPSDKQNGGNTKKYFQSPWEKFTKQSVCLWHESQLTNQKTNGMILSAWCVAILLFFSIRYSFERITKPNRTKPKRRGNEQGKTRKYWKTRGQNRFIRFTTKKRQDTKN